VYFLCTLHRPFARQTTANTHKKTKKQAFQGIREAESLKMLAAAGRANGI
jgi:hypothetical protein